MMRFLKKRIPAAGRSNYIKGSTIKIGGTASTTVELPKPTVPEGGITEAEVDAKLTNYATKAELGETNSTVKSNTDRIKKLEDKPSGPGGISEAEVDKKLEDYATKAELQSTDDAVAANNQWLTTLDETVGKKSTDPTIPSTGLVGKVDKLEDDSYNQSEDIYNLEQAVGQKKTPTTAGKGLLGDVEVLIDDVYSLSESDSRQWQDIQSNTNRIKALEDTPTPEGGITMAQLEKKLENYATTGDLQTTNEQVATHDQSITALNTKTDNTNTELGKQGKRIMDLEAASSTHITSEGLSVALENYVEKDVYTPVTEQVNTNTSAIADHETRIAALEGKPAPSEGITQAQLDRQLEPINTAIEDNSRLITAQGTKIEKNITDIQALQQSDVATSEALETQSRTITVLETNVQDNADKIAALETKGEEFYYIHTSRVISLTDKINSPIYTVFEGSVPDQTKGEYRFILSRLKSRKKEGKQWHIQMFSPRWNADTGVIVQPKCPCRMNWEDTFWTPAEGTPFTQWWLGKKTLSQVIDLTVDPKTNAFSNSNNKKQYWRVALYKKVPGYGTKGWKKVSNDCELALYVTPLGDVHVEVKK